MQLKEVRWRATCLQDVLRLAAQTHDTHTNQLELYEAGMCKHESVQTQITMQLPWDRVYLVSTAFHVNVSKSRMLRSFIRRLLESSPPNITKVEPTRVTDWPPRAI
jgi:hypothetical protein